MVDATARHATVCAEGSFKLCLTWRTPRSVIEQGRRAATREFFASSAVISSSAAILSMS